MPNAERPPRAARRAVSPPAVPVPLPAALTARAIWAAELRAGRRPPGAHDALSRAACCEAQGDDCDRDARACLARAERATAPSEAVRFARCALTFERSASVWRDRTAAFLAGDGAPVERAA